LQGAARCVGSSSTALRVCWQGTEDVRKLETACLGTVLDLNGLEADKSTFARFANRSSLEGILRLKDILKLYSMPTDLQSTDYLCYKARTRS